MSSPVIAGASIYKRPSVFKLSAFSGLPAIRSKALTSYGGPPAQANKKYYSTIKLYDNYRDITCETLNRLLANQGVSITQAELDRLKDIPGVKFDLPINDQTYPALVGLINSPKTRD